MYVGISSIRSGNVIVSLPDGFTSPAIISESAFAPAIPGRNVAKTAFTLSVSISRISIGPHVFRTKITFLPACANRFNTARSSSASASVFRSFPSMPGTMPIITTYSACASSTTSKYRANSAATSP